MSENEEWETEKVEVARPVGVVVSVRFPQELANRIFAEARRRGVKTSVVVREAVERAIDHTPGPSSDVQLSTVSEVSVAFFGGRSKIGRTTTAPSQFDPVTAGS